MRFGALVAIIAFVLFFSFGVREQSIEEFIPLDAPLYISAKPEFLSLNIAKALPILELVGIRLDQNDISSLIKYASGNLVVFYNPEPCFIVRMQSLAAVGRLFKSEFGLFSQEIQSVKIGGQQLKLRFLGNIIALCQSEKILKKLKRNNGLIGQRKAPAYAVVRLDLLSKLRYPSQLAFILKQLSNNKDLVLTLDESFNTSGQAACTLAGCDIGQNTYIQTAGEFFSLYKREKFLGIWKSYLKELDEKDQEAVDKELTSVRSETGDFYKDFLPNIGPEWGIKLVRIDYTKEPKYKLPGMIFYARVKDATTRAKIETLIFNLFKNMDNLSIKLVKGEKFTKIELDEESSRYLGEGFDPAFGFVDDFFIFTTFSSLFDRITVAKRGGCCHLEMSVNSKLVLQVINDHKQFITEAIVNNEFRAKIERQVIEEVDNRFTKEYLELKRSEFENEFRPLIKDPIELDKKVKYKLSKLRYDEQIKTFQKHLAEQSQTLGFKQRIKEIDQSVIRTLKAFDILGNINIKSLKKP